MSAETCPGGHRFCRDCLGQSTADLVVKVCMVTKLKDPFALLDRIFCHPAFQKRGPHHHSLIVPVGLAVLGNLGIIAKNQEAMRTGITRAEVFPAGSCQDFGICGASAGAGILVALIQETLSNRVFEPGLALEATAHTMNHLAALKDLKCCRQAVFATIGSVFSFLRVRLGFELPAFSQICMFSPKNPGCRGALCPYFAGSLPAK
jgi:hypothetical protein